MPHQLRGRYAPGVILRVAHSAPTNLGVHLDGQGVHHRRPHSVQPAGYFVRRPVKLAPRVQRGHHRLQPGNPGLRMQVHRNAAPVVGNAHRPVRRNPQLNAVAVARQRLIHRVVQQLFDEMMQAVNPGAPNIHTGAHPHRLQTLQHLNVVGRIIRRGLLRGRQCQ